MTTSDADQAGPDPRGPGAAGTPGAKDDLGALAARDAHVRRSFWGKFTRLAARLPFAGELAAAYYCAMDPATPTRVRATLLGALAYFILPIDAVPDIIAGLGFTDDAAVLAIAIRTVASHITPAHREAARRKLDEIAGPGDGTTATT